MDHDSQIFIRINPVEDPIEFLLTTQPMEMIKGGFVTKDDIRNTVETGQSYSKDEYMKAFPVENVSVVINISVDIDPILRTIEKVEKHIL